MFALLSNIPHILDSLVDHRAVLHRILLCLFRMRTQRTRHRISVFFESTIRPSSRMGSPSRLTYRCLRRDAWSSRRKSRSSCPSIFKRACLMVPQLCVTPDESHTDKTILSIRAALHDQSHLYDGSDSECARDDSRQECVSKDGRARTEFELTLITERHRVLPRDDRRRLPVRSQRRAMTPV